MGGGVGVEGMAVRSEGVRVTRLRITSSSAVSGLEAGGEGRLLVAHRAWTLAENVPGVIFSATKAMAVTAAILICCSAWPGNGFV